MSEEQSESNPNLKNSTVFSDRKMKAGIPHQMYILLLFINGFALLLAIKFFSIVSMCGFFFFLLITVLPIYIIHDKDSDAHVVWRHAIFGSSGLDNSETLQRKVVFINFSDTKDQTK